jgi:hypothetical protein
MKKLLNRVLVIALIVAFALAGFAYSEKSPEGKPLKCKQLLVVVNN